MLLGRLSCAPKTLLAKSLSARLIVCLHVRAVTLVSCTRSLIGTASCHLTIVQVCAVRVVPVPTQCTLSCACVVGTGCVADVRMMECSRCDMMRPINSRHCRDCNLCITDLDHHCPWTGKCIGRRTILYFKLFLCSLTAHIMLVIVSLGVSMVVAEFT